jgi:uncharacterized protein YdaT
MAQNMPWTEHQLPPSVRKLPPVIRRKVIEIANELLRERMDEGKAVRIATAKARAWALQQQRVREVSDEPNGNEW